MIKNCFFRHENIVQLIFKWLLFFICNIGILCAQTEVWVGVNKHSVFIEEEVELLFVVSGNNQEFGEPTFACENLVSASSGQKVITAHVDDDNNKLLQRYIYKLKPKELGIAKITNIIYQDSNNRLKKTDILLEIIAVESSDGPASWVEMIPSSFSPFCGEIIDIDLVYYHPFALELQDISYKIQLSDGYQLLNVVNSRKETFVEHKDYIYRKIIYKNRIIPKKNDDLKVALDYFDVVAYIATQNKNEFDKVFGKDEFFEDDFFRQKPLNDDFGGEKVTIPLTSSPIHIQVKELPICPDSFIGAIGDFSATAKLERDTSSARLTVSLTGTGNIEELQGDFVKKSEKFKVSKVSYSNTVYIDNSVSPPYVKKDVYIDLEPLTSEEVRIEPFFCYFSLEKKEYRYIDLDFILYHATFVTNKNFAAKYVLWLFVVILLISLILYRYKFVTIKGKK